MTFRRKYVKEQIRRPKSDKREQSKREGKKTRKKSDARKHKKHLRVQGIKPHQGIKRK